jgi:hypothetical protein
MSPKRVGELAARLGERLAGSARLRAWPTSATFNLVREMRDAYKHRLRLVQRLRLFIATVPTVRKWLRRYQQQGPSGLREESLHVKCEVLGAVGKYSRVCVKTLWPGTRFGSICGDFSKDSAGGRGKSQKWGYGP